MVERDARTLTNFASRVPTITPAHAIIVQPVLVNSIILPNDSSTL